MRLLRFWSSLPWQRMPLKTLQALSLLGSSPIASQGLQGAKQRGASGR